MPAPRSCRAQVRFAGVVVIPALLGACGERPPAPPRPPTAVRVQPAVAVSASDTVILTGSIAARVQGDLSFRLAGRIAARTAEVGDHVEAGQVLARLETAQQDADVASAAAAVDAAEATLRQTTAAFERQRTLMDSGFTTRTQYDNANQALLSARADLAGKRSSLATARDALDNTELRADADGVITARNGEAGQVVDVAQPIYGLARAGGRDAVFDVPEALVTRPPAEPTVRIALLSDPAVTTLGTVREVAPAVDPATGTVRIKIALGDVPPAMGLGAAVSGSGDFRPRAAIALPAGAFFARGTQAEVWVVDPDSHAVAERAVTVDSFRTGQLLLSSGVNAGELVVTAGNQSLRAGEVVAPVRDDAPTAAEVSR